MEDLRSLLKKELSETATSRSLTDYHNDAFYKELEAIFSNTVNLVWQEKHTDASNVLLNFFYEDARLRQQIAHAMAPMNDAEMLPEEKLTSLIELQGFYSLFRIQLVVEVTNYVSHLYEKASHRLMVGDLEGGGIISARARNTVRFYEVKLERLKAPLESYQGQMFLEMKEAYNVVYQVGEENLSKIADAVVRKESDVVRDKLAETEGEEARN